MINNAQDIILEVLAPVIDSQKFTRQGDECVFVNAKYAFRITYDQAKSVYVLDMAKLVEGGEAEFYNVSSYLFDDSSDERDARSVGGDFLDCLNNELGIQRSASLRKKDIALPSKSSGEGTPGIEAFTNRFLTIFPDYKDKYKDDVARYNGFMFDNFFSSVGPEVIKRTIQTNNKKHFSKLVDMLDNYYVEGDNEVQSTIMYSVIGETFRGNNDLFDTFKQMCADAKLGEHIIPAADNMMKYVINKNK